MNKNSKFELLRVYYLKNLGLRLSYNEINTIQRIASKIQLNAIHYCNGVIDAEKWEKIKSNAFNKLSKIFMSTSLTPDCIEIQGDPRGLCLKITNPIIKTTICPHDFN